MKKPQVTITTDGITNTKVLVDGKELEGVAGVRFSQSYKENAGLPVLQIDLKATNVTLDGILSSVLADVRKDTCAEIAACAKETNQEPPKEEQDE